MYFGALAPNDVKQPKELESENAKRKRLLAERSQEIDVLRANHPLEW